MKIRRDDKQLIKENPWAKLKIYNKLEIMDRTKADESFLDKTNDMFSKLIRSEGFFETYNNLKTRNNKYNKFIFLKLLNVQLEIIEKINEDENFDKESSYIDELATIINFLFHDYSKIKKELDIDDESFYSYFYEIENKLFKFEEIKSTYSTNVYLKLNDFIMAEERNEDNAFFLPIIFDKIFNDIKNNDFELIELFLNSYATSWKVNENTKCILLAIAFIFYYYSKYNTTYNGSDTLKKNINNFINKKNDYLSSTKWSFCDFIKSMLENFNLRYLTFFDCITKIKNVCEIRNFYRETSGTLIELDELILYWYLDFMLASSVDTYDGLIELIELEKTINKSAIAKNIRDKYFKQDSDQLKDNFESDFVKFFINDDSFYDAFKESRYSIFFNFINENYKREIITIFKTFDKKFNNDFLNKLNDDVINCFKEYFGFRSILKRNKLNDSDMKSFDEYLLLQDSNLNALIGQNESTQSVIIFKYIADRIEWSEKRLFDEKFKCIQIKRKTKEFDNEISSIINNGPIAFVEENCKYLQYEILNQDLANQFIDECKEAVELPNYKTFFPPRTLILKDGFAFDMHINITYNKHYPTAKEIDNEIEKYFKDNKYIYESCFLERDELVQILKIKLRKYHVDYKFNFETNKDKIFIFRYR